MYRYHHNMRSFIKDYIYSSKDDLARFVKDLKGNIIACNETLCKWSGLSAKEVIGKKIHEIPVWRNNVKECCFDEQIVVDGFTKYLNFKYIPLIDRPQARILVEKLPIVIENQLSGIAIKSKIIDVPCQFKIMTTSARQKVIIIQHGYFFDITLPIKLFKVLAYVAWYNLDYKSIANILYCSQSAVKKYIGQLYDLLKLYENQRNLNELQKVAQLFLSFDMVSACFDIEKESSPQWVA